MSARGKVKGRQENGATLIKKLWVGKRSLDDTKKILKELINLPDHAVSGSHA